MAAALAFLAGFLRDKVGGDPSMTRLVMLILAVDASALVAVIGVYVLSSRSPEATVIAALAGGITALVLNGIVALRSRTKPKE